MIGVVLMALLVRLMYCRMFPLRLGHLAVMMVLMALEARTQSHRHRAGHHGVRAEEDQRPAET